ncbi:MAG: tripeptidase T [Desulfobulbaceae bacterium]
MPGSPINRERLAECFVKLCETDSPSRSEGKVAALLRSIFTDLGADEIVEDDSAEITGSDTGNLIVRFGGTEPGDGVFFCCHMDTVEPGRGVKVRREGDLFTSAGETVLGSDDKSGIAAVIEALRHLRENRIPHRPVEIILTTCEEIGLLGAKALDPERIRARFGYALDSTGIDKVITAAPAANRLEITVRGVAAHAGLHPEWGINAITLAARGLTAVPQGRIDEESTVNIGTIQGGIASNIVPEKVSIIGEVRSHNERRLEELTDEVRGAFEDAVQGWNDPTGQARGKPEVSVGVNLDFPLMRLEPQDRVLRHVAAAAEKMGCPLEYRVAGGGSDANILNGYGLQTAIIATGMTHVHSTDEQVNLADMERLAELLVSIMTVDG